MKPYLRPVILILWIGCLLPVLDGGQAGAESRLFLPRLVWRQRSVLSEQLFVPFIDKPGPGTLLGAQFNALTEAGGLAQMLPTGITWARRNALLWSAVEASEGVYNWSAVSGLEAELKTAAQHNIQTILIVRDVPAWAQLDSGISCGRIRSDKFAAFANFMYQAVQRYSALPYRIQYYELWNEPDVAVGQVDQDSLYGCWGDVNDDYFGGAYFGQMLQAVTPQIKAANAQAQVLPGGLLLSCDPDTSGQCADPRPSRFLEGILRAGIGSDFSYFDGISFHAYDYAGSSLGAYGRLGWPGTTPVLNAKAEFIRSLLNRYGVSGKYLINTEVALITSGAVTNCDATCEQTKAYYAVQAYTTAMAQDLKANIWFTAISLWRNSGLLAPDLTPLPAYYAYSFFSSEMRNATYVGEDTRDSAVRVYQFSRGSGSVWVVWASGSVAAYTPPRTPDVLWAWNAAAQAYQSVTPSSSLVLTQAPLFLEWNP